MAKGIKDESASAEEYNQNTARPLNKLSSKLVILHIFMLFIVVALGFGIYFGKDSIQSLLSNKKIPKRYPRPRKKVFTSWKYLHLMI